MEDFEADFVLVGKRGSFWNLCTLVYFWVHTVLDLVKRNGKIHGIHFKIYVQHEYIGDIHVLGIMNGNITIRSYLLTLLNGLANNEQNIFRLFILMLIK